MTDWRILQIHSGHQTRGGADEVVAAEANLLTKAGHVVEQLLPPPVELNRTSNVRAGAEAIWNARVMGEVDAFIRRMHPDVIHVHTPFPGLSPAILRAGRRHGVPVVTTVHSYRYSCVAGTFLRDGSPCELCLGRSWKSPGIRYACYKGSRLASASMTTSLFVHKQAGTFSGDFIARVIALTDFAAESLAREGFPADRIVIKPNFCEGPAQAPEARTRVDTVLFIGRLVVEKGIRTLLEAWRLDPSLPRLRIAGSGPLQSEVQDAADRDERIDFLGHVSEEQVESAMLASDLLIFPSEWAEGQPVVLLKATAHGLPILCSDVPNFSAPLSRAGAAATFAVGSPSALSQGVQELSRRPETLGLLSRQARSLWEQEFTPDKALSRLETIYAEAIRTGFPS